MKRYVGLLVMGMMGMACSPTGSSAADLGVAQDLAVVEDQAGAVDQAVDQAVGPRLGLIAGGLGGDGNGDGVGAEARLKGPYGLAADGQGNMYIADSGNRTIRKLVVATGVVTTLAGSPGIIGTADGTGAAARFNSLSGVAADGAGNVYVADILSHTIRKIVVATGVVSTLAGTAGMSGTTNGMGAVARLNRPDGLAVDGAGNLYVADRGNHTIRKIVVATGDVSTLVGGANMPGSADGTGAVARFNGPSGVALDGAGSLYVTDSGNNTIRKVVVSSGVVTTPVGSAGMTGSADGTGAAARFSGPEGVTLDAAGNLYVTDFFNNTIRKVVVGTGVVTTLAGASMAGSADGTGTAARFSSPEGVALDGAGNLYVADKSNSTLRKIVVATGVVTTSVGSTVKDGSTEGTAAVARFKLPVAAALDGAGNLYVADSANSTIRKVVITTGAVSTLAGTAGMTGNVDGTGAAARFSSPAGLALDGAGNLYVADFTVNTIRKVVVATGAVTTLAGNFNMSGSTDATGTAALFKNPQGVAFDGAGNLYVADSGNQTLRKVVVATAVVTTPVGGAGMAGSADGTGNIARFSSPAAVAMDGMGNVKLIYDGSHEGTYIS